MQIIGISGKAEAGKSTLANILKEQLELQGHRTLLINYGDFVKFIAEKYYFWNGEKDEGGRTLLQHIGTKQGREKVDINIWVDMVINTVLVAQDDFDFAIVADCRFPNEFKRWEEFNIPITKIRISRPLEQSKLTEVQKQHASETSLDDYRDWDLFIYNNGTYEDLEERAKSIVTLIINK